MFVHTHTLELYIDTHVMKSMISFVNLIELKQWIWFMQVKLLLYISLKKHIQPNDAILLLYCIYVYGHSAFEGIVLKSQSELHANTKKNWYKNPLKTCEWILLPFTVHVTFCKEVGACSCVWSGYLWDIWEILPVQPSQKTFSCSNQIHYWCQKIIW